MWYDGKHMFIHIKYKKWHHASQIIHKCSISRVTRRRSEVTHIQYIHTHDTPSYINKNFKGFKREKKVKDDNK